MDAWTATWPSRCCGPIKPRTPPLRRRFATEGRATARLSHPNVVGVFDVGEEGGNPYLVMELVNGGTLAERILTGPPVGGRRAPGGAGHSGRAGRGPHGGGSSTATSSPPTC